MDRTTLATIRAHSRTMVRELGLLRDAWAPEEISLTQCHLLIELGDGLLSPSTLADRLVTDPAVVSRGLKQLVQRGLVRIDPDPSDRRVRLASLTSEGQALLERVNRSANLQVWRALGMLRPEERAQVADGLAAYAKALRRARGQASLTVRRIASRDDPHMSEIVRTVLPEHGASGPGFANQDAEVHRLTEAYAGPRAGYWVVVDDQDRVLGGAGFAALEGGAEGVCELRKMYFRPELRGLGMGARLLALILKRAREAGFTRCYLETLDQMDRARALYERFGFERIDAPMGDTGHHGCDIWYVREL